MQPDYYGLVGRAARRYLKERGCFKNINRNRDSRFDKRFLAIAAFPQTVPFVHTSKFFVDNLVLLSQGLAASSIHCGLNICS